MPFPQTVDRELRGALVKYGDGGAVTSFELASETMNALRRVESTKVALRWTLPQTSVVTLLFGSPSVANRVQGKFRKGRYMIGTLRNTSALEVEQVGPRRWSVQITLPWTATPDDVEVCISASYDKPRQILLNHDPWSPATATAEIRRLLETISAVTDMTNAMRHGSGSMFTLLATLDSEKVARSAIELLHNQSQPFLQDARMSVVLMHTCILNSPEKVLEDTKRRIDALVDALGGAPVRYQVKSSDDSNSPSTLYLESEDADYLSKAAKLLESLLQEAIPDELVQDDVPLQLTNDLAALHLDTAPECPACLEKPELAIRLRCGHNYCADECFEALCTSEEGTWADYSINCVQCSTPISMLDLITNLSTTVFEKVLQRSFESYVRRHPEQFQQCSTAKCGYLYRPTSIPGITAIRTCSGCFASNCTYCKSKQHNPTSCDDQQADQAFAEYMSSNGVKRCPRCAMPITKVEGCNRIHCRCGAHLCW